MNTKITTILLNLGFCALIVAGLGCESEAQKGAGIGALAGAGIGAIAGHQSGKAGQGALIGGAVGAGAGYILGNEGDKKRTQEEMDQLKNEMNTVTVNVTNSNGSIIPVKLRKQGVGYVGPRGEYYNTLPTEDQLRPIYGF